MSSIIGVIGAGVTGSRVVEQLSLFGAERVAVYDTVSSRAQRLAALHNNASCQVLAVAQTEITQCDVVVLACGAAHAGLAAQFIRSGVHVVSLSDDVSDCMNLLALNDQATDMNVVVTGSGKFVEVQGTAEKTPFDRTELDALLDLALKGTNELTKIQQEVLRTARS
jgi:ribonuclease PH